MHPFLVKHLLLPAHERLLGRPTFAWLRRIEDSQWWPLHRLRELQHRKLRRLLGHASRMCPYYRRMFDSAGLAPQSITLAQLANLPTLTKDLIREHGAALIDPAVRGGLHRYSTGGSTGEPLRFWIDRSRQAADQAARMRTRRWFGIQPGDRELYLWGSPVELVAQDRLKSWRDRLTNHRLLNAFEMTPRRMSQYFDTLERYDPIHVFGYPSSIARLVRHAVETGRRVRSKSLKAVFTTGELLLPADRAIIEEAFAVPVADGYGAREAGFIAHQCPMGRYHVTMESLIVELLDPQGRPVEGGAAGEVTVTHLDAIGMPFVRYRTGDLARWGGACPCGRSLQTLEIVEGRRTDMLRTAGGGEAHALSVIYVLREEPGVRRFKVVQRPNLDLDVAVVAEPAFDQQRQTEVRRLLRQRIGGSAQVRLRLVDEIPPDPSGKHRYVVREGCESPALPRG